MLPRKPLLLLSLFGVAIAASIWVTYMPQEAEAVAAPVIPKRSAPTKVAEKTHQAERPILALDNLQRPSMTVGEVNPFSGKSWYVPPPPAPEPPPPKPTAPPLPFTYVGKMEEEGRWVVYLAKGEKFYSVSKGETFDQVYRLEDVENGNVVIQYLPLSTKQVIAIGIESL